MRFELEDVAVIGQEPHPEPGQRSLLKDHAPDQKNQVIRPILDFVEVVRAPEPLSPSLRLPDFSGSDSACLF